MKLKCDSKIEGRRLFLALLYIFVSNKCVYLDYLSEGEVVSNNRNFKTFNEIKSLGRKNYILKYGIVGWGIYQNSNLSNTRFTNVNMSSAVLGDSNMNKIEICHVSLADAYIHDTNLGFEEQKAPLTIERCELSNSRIVDSNLQDLSIYNCNIEGMKIDGILVSDLINTYKSTLKTEINKM